MSDKMDLNSNHTNGVSPETEPGMNLISPDFDLIMVNRVNERLYGKPMVELLGKKCYREFERREEPCPHCPGRLSLTTGESHSAETQGRRDDGTWFYVRVRTYPVHGPDNQPTGFIEVVEDITEEKRAESLAYIDSDLHSTLANVDTVQKALQYCLEAAMRVEGIDAGCVFALDPPQHEASLVLQRNFPLSFVEALAESELESVMSGQLPSRLRRIPGAPHAGEVIPLLHRSQRIAILIAGAYVYPSIPPSLRAGLHALGATTGNAISRILAERSRGDAIADLESFINIAPVATWLLDPQGRITMWNRAAERLLGWRRGEVLGRKPYFAPLAPDELLAQPMSTPGGEHNREVTLLAKDGRAVEVRLTAAPFRDIIGNASAVIVMAEDLTAQRKLAKLEMTVQAATATNASPAALAIPPGERGGTDS